MSPVILVQAVATALPLPAELVTTWLMPVTRAALKHVILFPGPRSARLGAGCCVRGEAWRQGGPSVGLSAAQGGLCVFPTQRAAGWWGGRLKACVFSVNLPTAQKLLEQRTVRCMEDCSR